jgi:hypothetical protein
MSFTSSVTRVSVHGLSNLGTQVSNHTSSHFFRAPRFPYMQCFIAYWRLKTPGASLPLNYRFSTFLRIKSVLHTSCEAEALRGWRPRVCFQNIRAYFPNGVLQKPETASQNWRRIVYIGRKLNHSRLVAITQSPIFMLLLCWYFFYR